MYLAFFSVLISTILLIVIGLRHFILMQRYKDFPSYRLDRHLIYLFLTRRMPKDVAFTTFIFQELLKICKTKKEGFCLIWVFEPFLFIYGEEAIKTFSNEQAATDKPDLYRTMEVGFGKGLITSNGEKWKTERRMINPAFHIGMLKDKVPIFNENAALLVQNLRETSNEVTLDMFYFLRICAFRIFSESILGIKLNYEENFEKVNQMADYVDKVSEFIIHKMYIPMYNWKYIMNLFPYVRRSLWYHKELCDFSGKILHELKEKTIRDINRKAVTSEDETDSRKRQKSLAEILLKMHIEYPTFTMKDVQDHVNTFLSAGFDTVSLTLMWCLFLLGLHPEIQERAHQEVSVLPMNDIKYKDLHKLTYLDCIIRETLRIYPIAPIYARHLSKDVQCGKYLVPENTTIVTFSYLWHRDPKFNNDPESFRPDRFLENVEKRQSWTHLPFAEGIRSCIGKNFAMMEIKIILAHILQNLKVTSLDQRTDIQPNWAITLKNNKAMRMKFSSRQTSNKLK